MHIVLIALLVAVCAYAIGLVLINNREVAVNLMFADVPTMNLGLLLVITIVLGVVLGMLLALLVFRVFQSKWEINRLNKELKLTQSQLTEANVKLAKQAESRPVETVVVENTTPTTNTPPNL